MKRITTILGLFISLALGFELQAQVSEDVIALDDIRLAADDLLAPDGEVYTPEEWWEIKRSARDPRARIDLSRLDPVTNEIWAPEETITSDDLPLKTGSQVAFMGAKASASGMFRFNARAGDGQLYTVVLDKTLHTVLLRKNLLRKLGYKIPGLEWLSSLSVEFESLDDLNRFEKKLIPEATLGAPERWVESRNEERLTLKLKDIAILKPNLEDHYNVAFGVPPQMLSSRTLRSLLIPYALLNVRESINKVKWHEGRIDNRFVRLPHFTQASFNATIDDAKWILRRLNKLGREDFKEIVAAAHFPEEAALLLTEKLISRRNSLNALFGMIVKDLPFDSEISAGSALVKGELKEESWPGYASNFAHGHPDSPFEDTGYYLLAGLQSIGIDELVSRANDYLQGFDVNEAKIEFHQDQFSAGLEHFIETGELRDFGVGTWVSPVLNGNAIVSRDIVLGQYMGTDNLVQMADTFGYALSLGAHVGIENLGPSYSAYLRGTLSYLKTYTHLKPVKSLKESLKEPYINMIVPYLKSRLTTALEGMGADETDQSKAEEFYELIGKYLGVGESLIITEKITPQALLSGATTMLNTRVSLALNAEYITLKRIHLHRESSDVIQVYIDNGNAHGLELSFSMDHLIPVTKLSFRREQGKYRVAFNKLNINVDEEENPNLRAHAKALASVLREGNSEALHALTRPYIISQEYTDWSSKFKLLAWRMKTLDGSGILTVTDPEGHASEFFSLTDATQSGVNYKDFAKDVANYWLKKLWNDSSKAIQLGNNTWQSPSQTTFGMSETRSSRFESYWDSNRERFSRPFIGLTNQIQGWSVSKRKLQTRLQEINDKYQTILFPQKVLEDVEKLKLYDISIHVNFYQQGIERLRHLDLAKIERAFSRERRGNSRVCNNRSGNNRLMNCFRSGEMDYSNLIATESRSCKRLQQRGAAKSEAKCLLNLATLLHQHLPFKDFKDIIGEENFYLYGAVTGFRSKSEVLYEPELSSSLGRITERSWAGPLQAVRELIGMQEGEMNGYWLRERLN